MADIKTRIRELREEKHLSQYAFAPKIGVAQSTIGNWESGSREPNAETLVKLADYFGVSLDYLFGRTDIRDGHIIKAPTELAAEEVVSVEKSGSAELTPDEILAIKKMLAGQKQ